MGLYLTTTDPEVITVCEANRAGRQELIDRAADWARERGFEEFFVGGHGRRTLISGLPGIPQGFGRWTQPKRGCSHPYRTNEDEVKALNALRFDGQPVPGLPDSVHSDTDADGRSFLMWPKPFVWDDAAWVGYSHMPEKAARELFGDQWTECLPSHYWGAREAFQDAERAVRR